MAVKDVPSKSSGMAIYPAELVRMILGKVEKRHQKQLNPWFRATIAGFSGEGLAYLTKTGEANFDDQPCLFIGEQPAIGDQVYCIRVNGQQPLIIGPIAHKIPSAYAWKSTVSNIPTSEARAISWDVLRVDTHGHFLDPSKFQIQVDGIYLFGTNIGWNTDPDGRRITDIRKNAVSPFSGEDSGKILCRTAWKATSSDNTQNCWGLDYLTRADYLQTIVYQSSGATLGIAAAGGTTTNTPFFQSFWAVMVAQPRYF